MKLLKVYFRGSNTSFSIFRQSRVPMFIDCLNQNPLIIVGAFSRKLQIEQSLAVSDFGRDHMPNW